MHRRVGVGLQGRAEQELGVRVGRGLIERVGRADLTDLAEVHDRDAVTDVLHDREVVGDEEQRESVLGLQVLRAG